LKYDSDFADYIRSYASSGDSTGTDDDDRVDEVNQLLKLNIDCLYYDIDDMLMGHNHKFTVIHLNIPNLLSK